MIPTYSRHLFVAALLMTVAACQTEDKAPQPRYVSNSAGRGAAATLQPASAAQVDAKASPSPQDNRYFIEFRSRYALSYGHTYVVFGKQNKAGGMISPEVAGLHPKSMSEVPYVLGHFVPVPAETGWSDGDLEEQYRSASWRVMLTEAQYRDVVAEIRELQKTSPTWQAAIYNCNAFVAAIARTMGYKTPPVQIRPQEFVTKLREMNTG
ncbi:MAG: hypothetical protein ABS58_06240 [Mesorhizobium sp. SCN 65-20]|nr:MAG: hypothetical protein ABS58_06240 [Mesorhizobium sp. SCN 65-20]